MALRNSQCRSSSAALPAACQRSQCHVPHEAGAVMLCHMCGEHSHAPVYSLKQLCVGCVEPFAALRKKTRPPARRVKVFHFRPPHSLPGILKFHASLSISESLRDCAPHVDCRDIVETNDASRQCGLVDTGFCEFRPYRQRIVQRMLAACYPPVEKSARVCVCCSLCTRRLRLRGSWLVVTCA